MPSRVGEMRSLPTPTPGAAQRTRVGVADSGRSHETRLWLQPSIPEAKEASRLRVESFPRLLSRSEVVPAVILPQFVLSHDVV